MGLLDIKDNPDYVNANEATKRAIFDQYSQDDPDYQNANPATRDAIRKEFGLTPVGTTSNRAENPEQLTDVANRYATQSILTQGVGAPEYVASSGLRAAQAGLINPAGGATYNAAQAVKPGWFAEVPGVAKNVAQEVGKRAYALKDLSPAGMLTDIGERGLVGSIADLGKYFIEPFGGKVTLGQAAGAVGKGLVAGAVAPENLLTLPYQMAGYEQEKIRANPTAPEYQTNPYAQAYRGEYATQGAAGAANRRNAIASQQYGGLTQEEQDILEQDRIARAIRRKAAEKVLGPVAPRGM